MDKYTDSFTTPCKLGDIIYKINLRGNYESHWKPCIESLKVTEFSRKLDKSNNDLGWGIIADTTRFSISSFGKTIFINKHEAEKALKDLIK